MNLLHMKYAVEIAETNSINRAADRLFVGQSALSRAIKELEAGLGVTLFTRSAKGMFLTPDGEVFIRHAKKILRQVDDVEALFKAGPTGKKQFSVSVPRASYIAEAFAAFSTGITGNEEAELFYRETNSMHTVRGVLQDDYKLGIIRCSERHEKYYKSLLEEKNLLGELVAEFSLVLLAGAKSPLAGQESPSRSDLAGLMEIVHADSFVPPSNGDGQDAPAESGRRIYVFERGSQLELLARNPETYMWVSPLPQQLLDRFGLVQRPCAGDRRRCKDVLIHRRDYALTPLDDRFISELIRVKRQVLR